MKIQKAEEKLKCMETILERERMKAEANRKKNESVEEVKAIKEQVKNEVKNVKNIFHNKMDSMQKETERLKFQKLQRLSQLKYTMTKMLIDQGTRGNRSNCLVDKDDQKIS